tara:strand:- start:8154 stop:8387 length:234 start_codon:yes stop_codon:yes gene_type:complete
VAKKKSYMNNENLLIEGFFDKLGKFLKIYKQIKKEKKLLKNPSIAKQVKAVTKQFDDLESSLKKQAKELGIKLPPRL